MQELEQEDDLLNKVPVRYASPSNTISRVDSTTFEESACETLQRILRVRQAATYWLPNARCMVCHWDTSATAVNERCRSASTKTLAISQAGMICFIVDSVTRLEFT